MQEIENFYWIEDIGFAILDSEDQILLDSKKYLPALNDLFNAAREITSGIDGLLEDLLDNEEWNYYEKVIHNTSFFTSKFKSIILRKHP